MQPTTSVRWKNESKCGIMQLTISSGRNAGDPGASKKIVALLLCSSSLFGNNKINTPLWCTLFLNEVRMNTIQSDSLLSEKETAALLHISPRKLQDDRANRRGLPYTRIVRKIFYDRKDIEIYLRENTVAHA